MAGKMAEWVKALATQVSRPDVEATCVKNPSKAGCGGAPVMAALLRQGGRQGSCMKLEGWLTGQGNKEQNGCEFKQGRR